MMSCIKDLSRLFRLVSLFEFVSFLCRVRIGFWENSVPDTARMELVFDYLKISTISVSGLFGKKQKLRRNIFQSCVYEV